MSVQIKYMQTNNTNRQVTVWKGVKNSERQEELPRALQV